MVTNDDFGNRIIMSGAVINLRLNGEKKTRRIGLVDKASRTLNVTRKRYKHLHRKSNSYGFNHYILSTASVVNKVLLKDDFGYYMIPIKDILKKGKFLYFKEQGFEIQIFLDILEINSYKTMQK